MAEKNLVEETLIQIQNLEEVINENAKEILASTMKEEISELVKESMKDETNEQSDDIDMIDIEKDEDSDEVDVDSMEISATDSDEDELDMDMIDMDMDDEDSDDMGMGMDDMDIDMDDETIDLTDASDEEVLKVFKAMSAEDEITVTKDGDYIHLTDDSEDVEYIIQDDEDFDDMDDSLFEEKSEKKEKEVKSNKKDAMFVPKSKMHEEDEMEESEYDELDESWLEEGDDETIYEIALDVTDNDDENELEEMDEIHEAKLSSKPKVGKGAKTGSASKFSYKKSTGGFKEKMKQGTKGVGMGKAKFEFKEEATLEMPSRTGIKLSKEEATEAARTYGTGWRKGALKKGARAGQESARTHTESVQKEFETLKAKNEEYRKALNMFRDKLNEVAIFNSNLAYATRLFTEHSTSKQEKINILRRFDSAETIKESKALYKTIKDELSGDDVRKPVTESIERIIDTEQKSGSSVNLIESKTYENPQFLRMKDIMSKIIK